MILSAVLVQSALALTILCDLALLIVLFSKSVRGPIFVLFAVHLVGVLGWAASVLTTIRTGSATALKLTFVFALVLAVAKYVFVDIFPGNTLNKHWRSYWYFLPAIGVGILSLFDQTIFLDFTIDRGRAAIITNGPYTDLYAGTISFLLIYPLIILFRKYKKETNKIVKAQLKYLFAGFGIFFLVGLLTNEILPVYFQIYMFNATGPIFSLVLIAFTFYIITKYHFLDIWIIIQRSLIFAILLTLTIGLYLILVGIFGYLFQKTTDMTMLLSAGITTLLGIWGTPIVERVFRKWTDPLFFQDPYDFTEAMRTLTRIGNEHIELETIVDRSVTALTRILKSERVSFFFPRSEEEQRAMLAQVRSLHSPQGDTDRTVIRRSNLTYRRASKRRKDREEFLSTHQAEIAIPILLEQKFLGVLFMGKKRSGAPYTQNDIDLLENFASQIAVAIEKALLYQQVTAYSTELEAKVAERTKEILALREEEHRMMLDISHGLQTPLTIMKNEIGTLRSVEGNDSVIEHFERSIDKASKFVYDLLHLARLEKTKEQRTERLDLTSLLEEVIEYFEVVAENKGVSVHATIDKALAVQGSKEELTEAVSNLLSNAIKYMKPDGDKVITVTATKTGAHCKVTITDTGVGISEAHLARLSERFYRATDGEIKGTGLGLAITKRIVEKHEGSLTIESTLGKGSTFTITLPAVTAD